MPKRSGTKRIQSSLNLDAGQQARTEQAKKCSPCNLLPNELLREIFFHYVWTNYDPPGRLLCVCHFWKSVALEFPLLWTNIFYGDRMWSQRDVEDEEGLYYRMSGMTLCVNEESLLRVLKRIGTSKFELTVCYYREQGKFSFKLDLAEHFKRCRLLRFIGDHCDSWDFVPWIKSIKLPCLEECIILLDIFFYDHYPLGEILLQSCPILWNYHITRLQNDNIYRKLLSRLTKLSIGYLDTTVLGKLSEEPTVLERLEELSILNHRVPPNLTQDASLLIMPSLRKVSLTRTSPYILSDGIWAQITDLSLTCLTSWKGGPNGTISFPLLTHLSINQSWAHITNLSAPNLITLVLRGQFRLRSLNCDYITLLPKILHLDKTMPDKILYPLISRIGEKLEEVHLTHFKQNGKITEKFASSWIAQKGVMNICPLLEKIDILYLKPNTPTDRETTLQVLRKLIDERNLESPLREVKCGFYDSRGSLEIASRKWWAIEWTELL